MVDEKKVKDWLEFDRVNQMVKIKHGLPVGHPLAAYKDEKNNFDAKRYFRKFLTLVYEIIMDLEKNWPPIPGMTMKKPSVHYLPCCFKEEFKKPEVKRCHHQDFTTPSLTRSKIGVAFTWPSNCQMGLFTWWTWTSTS